jgi:peptidoglycan/xylan/chitin deacetylase (PgdA/CDA1 family)
MGRRERAATSAPNQTHVPLLLCWPAWLLDFATDQRVFHNLPASLVYSKVRRSLLAQIPMERVLKTRPLICLTFDLERDPTGPFEGADSATAQPFLEALIEETAGTGLRTTIFVQGAMVEPLAVPLRLLVKLGHEVGLHGYNHELWGSRNWILRRTPVKVAERRRRLALSLDAFARMGLPRPQSFRAPNFTIDAYTYRLLKEAAFRVDSSVAPQKGPCLPTSRRGGRPYILPVTASPSAQLLARTILGLRMPVAATFNHLNYDEAVRPAPELLRGVLWPWLRWQASQLVLPHVVTYAHNWEFRVAPKHSLRKYIKHWQELAASLNASFANISEAASLVFPGGAP